MKLHFLTQMEEIEEKLANIDTLSLPLNLQQTSTCTTCTTHVMACLPRQQQRAPAHTASIIEDVAFHGEKLGMHTDLREPLVKTGLQ